MAPKRTKQGTWEIRWRSADGRQHRKRFKRQEDAKQAEIRALGQVQDGSFVNPARGRITLAEFAEQWLRGAHDLRARSVAIYRGALAHILPVLGDLRLANITSDDIDTYLAGRLAEGAAPSTVHREYRTLRRLFRLAVQRNRLPRSPVDDATEPALPDTEMRFLTADQLMHLAASVDWLKPGRGKDPAPIPERYRTLILVAGWGGLRWGELAGLDATQVDIPGSRVQVIRQLDAKGNLAAPKTKRSRRWVKLPQIVTAELAEHIDGRSGFVWTMPEGGPLDHSRFQTRIWRPACARAGFGTLVIKRADWVDNGTRRRRRETRRYEGLRIHDLRHTAVALAIRAGAHPKAIQERMGHASIRVTLDLYGHLFEGMDAALADSLDTMITETRPTLRAVK